MGRDTITANYSPGSALGTGAKTSIEGSTIIVDSNLQQKNGQIDGLYQLIEVIRKSELSGKDDAVRHLTNVKEELSENSEPDPTLIAKFMNRAKEVINFADKGTDVAKKAAEVYEKFGMQFPS